MIRETPYFFETSKYDREKSAYVPNKEQVWVFGIYKKTLVSLGIHIFKSELGGRIGHYATTEWCFLIDKNQRSIIEEHFKELSE